MDYRSGKCSQCGAEYKVPASFAHNVARCKVCKGVVHLGPPKSTEGASPTAMPAKRVVPKPAAAPAARPAPAPRPAPPAAAGTPRPTPRPEAPERAQPAAESRTTAASRAPRASDGEAGERPARRARGHAPREKKKAPMAGILSGVGLVVVAAVIVLFRDAIFGSDAKPAEDTLAAAPADTPSPTSEPVTPAVQPETPAEPEAGSAGAPAEPAPEEPVAKKAPEPKDPASIDLASEPDFKPTPDTTPEEWASMQELMVKWMDVEAGAAGNRAKLELIKQGRKAMPVILNYFKRLDFATREGRSNGDQCQKTLMQICNGSNFDWRYADEAAGRNYDNPDDVWFCKRATQLWLGSWKQVEKSIEAWIKLAKLADKDPAEAQRLRELFGKGTEAGGQEEPAGLSNDDLDVE